jgi:hypothetical protein
VLSRRWLQACISPTMAAWNQTTPTTLIKEM